MTVERDFGIIMSIATQEMGIAHTPEQAGLKAALAAELGVATREPSLYTASLPGFNAGVRMGEMLGKIRKTLVTEAGDPHE